MSSRTVIRLTLGQLAQLLGLPFGNSIAAVACHVERDEIRIVFTGPAAHPWWPGESPREVEVVVEQVGHVRLVESRLPEVHS